MQNNFYEEKLYPIQDKILRQIDHLGTNFYLTGGTALSRFYLNHRYSEDLDFFVNDDKMFLAQLQGIQNHLSHNFNVSVMKKEDRFARYYVKSDHTELKLEFINDVPFYLGKTKSFKLFSKIDNLLNILSNKITSLRDRDEPKDFADILFINYHTDINWEQIFTASLSKAAGIFPPVIAEVIDQFDLAKLDILQWIQTPGKMELTRMKDKLLNNLMGIL